MRVYANILVFTVFMLLFQLTGTSLYAQQCGYENAYLFVVHVHAPKQTTKIPNLRMYLVDEQDEPVRVSVSFKENEQWKHRLDTLFFWDNEQAKPEAATKPLLRQKFYHIGGDDLVAVHLNPADLKQPDKYPIYRLKIAAGYDETTGMAYPSQTIHLPLGKAVNICQNNLHRNVTSTQTVFTYDRQPFKPIDITLDASGAETGAIIAPATGLRYALRFDYKAITMRRGGTETYVLNGVKVYDTETGRLHQQLPIPRTTQSSAKESKYIVQFGDFYNRGLTTAKDFSVQLASWRDEQLKGFRQQLQYYIFDTASNTYVLDTTLSNYKDVFFDEPLKKMRRYDYKVSALSRTAYTYQLENNKWVPIDTSETMFEPILFKIKYPSTQFLQVNEKWHNLPLKAAIGNTVKLLVRDTFWLYNTCDDTLYISKVESAFSHFFSIHNTLPPKQRTPLIFSGLFSSETMDFDMKYFNCALTLNDGAILGLGLAIPVVSNLATVYYHADSSISYAIANKEKARFTLAVLADANGYLRAMGTVLDRDTNLKVGNWSYFNPGSLSSHDVAYSKSVSLSALDEVSGQPHNRFKVKVWENGSWKHPITDVSNENIRLFVSPATDSIVAYTDTTSYRFAIAYKQLPTYFKKPFYLLRPQESTLKIGDLESPFQLMKDQYAILLNPERIQSAKQTTTKLTNKLIAALQQQYPKLGTVRISAQQTGISLSLLDDKEKAKLLQQLVNDSNVAFICQLYGFNHQPTLFYCDTKVIVNIDIADEGQLRRKALRLGYTKMTIDDGNNRFWLTYPGKLIDARFFDTFDKLTKEKQVLGAYLNQYREPEFDRNDW